MSLFVPQAMPVIQTNKEVFGIKVSRLLSVEIILFWLVPH
jgi:hypothetical protein